MKTRAGIIASLALAVTSGSAVAQTLEDYQPLLDNSPFLSTAFKQRIAADAGVNDLTFTGFADTDGSWKLCLISNSTAVVTWAKVGESVGEYKITAFDPNTKIITFEKGGISSTLGIAPIP